MQPIFSLNPFNIATYLCTSENSLVTTYQAIVKAIPITALHIEPKLRVFDNNPYIPDSIGRCLAFTVVENRKLQNINIVARITDCLTNLFSLTFLILALLYFNTPYLSYC